jgi:hypothetical protein
MVIFSPKWFPRDKRTHVQPDDNIGNTEKKTPNKKVIHISVFKKQNIGENIFYKKKTNSPQDYNAMMTFLTKSYKCIY